MGDAVDTVRADARFGVAFLHRHGLSLLLVFLGVLAPLAAFGALAHELREGGGFFFDIPLLEAAHALEHAGFDRFFVVIAALGYQWGVVPLDAALVVALGWRRRMREGLFAGIAIIGSALLNLGAKPLFARDRPSLWASIAPEGNYSFPSGHAMGSMTLACVLVLLCWWTRWRWPALAGAIVFVALVGASRVYLGVHFPSDILAGWAAAIAWTYAVYGTVFRARIRPWGGAGARRAGA
ncbi:phosphatase PAP2 family protein [Dokdonella sp.]|uniref:phosphatase PAP2 family protein n=1 Tax=Dokdonella sp. TaxID=2291710 RepID=UPI002F423724